MTILLKVKRGLPYTMDPDDKPSFEQWMNRIDLLMWKHRGVSIYDLEDCPFRDWYDDRIRPVRAANRALKRAGGDSC